MEYLVIYERMEGMIIARMISMPCRILMKYRMTIES